MDQRRSWKHDVRRVQVRTGRHLGDVRVTAMLDMRARGGPVRNPVLTAGAASTIRMRHHRRDRPAIMHVRRSRLQHVHREGERDGDGQQLPKQAE